MAAIILSYVETNEAVLHLFALPASKNAGPRNVTLPQSQHCAPIPTSSFQRPARPCGAHIRVVPHRATSLESKQCLTTPAIDTRLPGAVSFPTTALPCLPCRSAYSASQIITTAPAQALYLPRCQYLHPSAPTIHVLRYSAFANLGERPRSVSLNPSRCMGAFPAATAPVHVRIHIVLWAGRFALFRPLVSPLRQQELMRAG